eukprot:GILI01004554.1.p1 GENE.GILI01004554.1~~GILI01004554.1.p1  ORF type:complete len:122 (+),score=14.54 GILI01004554.1:94-459(+)
MTNTQMFSVKPRTSCPHLDNNLCPNVPDCLPLQSAACEVCNDGSENWVCLCCYKVLCSRYVNSHMSEHNQQEGHCVALSLADMSVWCYCCEDYLDFYVIPPLKPVYAELYRQKFGQSIFFV